MTDKDIKKADEYVDLNMEKKTIVIKNIIKTLGFDLTKLYFKISKDDYYQNVKKLFADTNEFKKNYANIRMLFGKDKHELKDTIKGSALVKLLNGFLNEFGLIIKDSRTWTSNNNVKKRLIFYKIIIDKKYIKILTP